MLAWKRLNQTILTECDRMIDLPPVERIQIGRRLLDKSREALRRLFFLSYAYRMTGISRLSEPGRKRTAGGIDLQRLESVALSGRGRNDHGRCHWLRLAVH